MLDEAGLIFGIVAETQDVATDEQALAAGHLVHFTDADYMTVNSPIEMRPSEGAAAAGARCRRAQ